MEIWVKRGAELRPGEIDQIDEVQKREFGARPIRSVDFGENIFFLLKEEEKLMAVGSLITIEPVLYNGEPFSLLGIGGVVANEKGKGYGGWVVREIRKYLNGVGKTGVGFCKAHNRGFYERCGFGVDEASIKRLVYLTGSKKITNSTDDLLIYFNGKDNFMRSVLENPTEEVVLPRPPDW